MTSFEDLPNEVLMRIFAFLDIVNVTHIAQVSKRLRNFCKDESLMQKFVEKINLYNKKVPIKFLEKIMDYGCKYLSLNTAFLEDKDANIHGEIKLNNPSKLKYLDISSCGGNTELILESFLESCKSLEKLALRDGLQDLNGLPINYGMKSQKFANILNNLFTQNCQTLQVKLVKYFNYQFFAPKLTPIPFTFFPKKGSKLNLDTTFINKRILLLPLLSASEILV